MLYVSDLQSAANCLQISQKSIISTQRALSEIVTVATVDPLVSAGTKINLLEDAQRNNNTLVHTETSVLCCGRTRSLTCVLESGRSQLMTPLRLSSAIFELSLWAKTMVRGMHSSVSSVA